MSTYHDFVKFYFSFYSCPKWLSLRLFETCTSIHTMSEENVGLYMGSLAEELFQKLLLQDKYFTHNCTYNLCLCHAYCPYLWKITSNIIPQSIEKYITIEILSESFTQKEFEFHWGLCLSQNSQQGILKFYLSLYLNLSTYNRTFPT